MNNSRSTDVVKSISVRGIGFAGLFLSCLTGCPGSLDPAFLQPGGIAPGGTGGAGGDVVLMDCPDAPAKLATGCSGASCHISTFGPIWGDFATQDGMLASRLINIAAKASPACNGQTKLVNPTKPASGVLFERLTTTSCTREMPPGPMEATPAQQLSDADRASLVACLKGWLTPQLQ